MILVEETKAQLGYDPSTLAIGSHESVVCQCPKCGKVSQREMRHSGRTCYGCRPGRTPLSAEHHAKRKIEVAEYRKDWFARYRQTVKGKIITRLKTAAIQSFGSSKGFPFDYTWQESVEHFERLLAACGSKCPKCAVDISKDFCIEYAIPVSQAVTYEAKRNLFRLENMGVVCEPCLQSGRWRERIDENKAKGLSATGLTAQEIEKRKREGKGNWTRKHRLTARGKEISLFRSALAGMLKRGYEARRLPFRAFELKAHIEFKLEQCNHMCPICSTDLNKVGYEIDHVIPLSQARQVTEVKALFALENLDVICRDCNIRVKGSRLVSYEHLKSSIKGGRKVLPIQITGST